MGMKGVLGRREAMMTYGGAALLPTLFGLEQAARIEAAQKVTGNKYKRLIYLWRDGGGPASLDFDDPKPGSKEVDTVFRTVPTGVQGLRLTEPFAQLAEGMEQALMFKTRIGGSLDHLPAIADALQRNASTGQHFPYQAAKGGMPYVHAESPNLINAANYRRNAFSVHLGIESRWSSQEHAYAFPSFGTARKGLAARSQLLHTLESLGSERIQGPGPDEWDEHKETAMEILARAKKASLTLPEDEQTRYAGGYRPCPGTLLPLLARELIREKIASVVFLRMGYHPNDPTGFDMHRYLPQDLPEAGFRFSAGVAALLDDYKKGLLEDTVIVCDSEFGRSNRLNKDGGREHSSFHSSFIVGEAFQKGVVVGKTNQRCEPVDEPVTNKDFAEIVMQGVSSTPDFAARERLPKDIFSATR